MVNNGDADKPASDTTASEAGADAQEGAGWAAEDEEEELQQQEEEEEIEEARVARLAEYAAAKAEEDAIRKVFSSQAVVPKLSAGATTINCILFS